MTYIVRSRFGEQHMAKMAELQQMMGLSASSILRLLIERAEVVSQPIVEVSLSKKNSSDALALVSNGVAAVVQP